VGRVDQRHPDREREQVLLPPVEIDAVLERAVRLAGLVGRGAVDLQDLVPGRDVGKNETSRHIRGGRLLTELERDAFKRLALQRQHLPRERGAVVRDR
jgi:hypothetical protein